MGARLPHTIHDYGDIRPTADGAYHYRFCYDAEGMDVAIEARDTHTGYGYRIDIGSSWMRKRYDYFINVGPGLDAYIAESCNIYCLCRRPHQDWEGL